MKLSIISGDKRLQTPLLKRCLKAMLLNISILLCRRAGTRPSVTVICTTNYTGLY
ncbi:MAG: hypothetical protein ACTS78_04675 [Arsenophonus sp. NC-WZS1-MAG3]